MRCKNCNREIADNVNFCIYCGTKQHGTEQEEINAEEHIDKHENIDEKEELQENVTEESIDEQKELQENINDQDNSEFNDINETSDVKILEKKSEKFNKIPNLKKILAVILAVIMVVGVPAAFIYKSKIQEGIISNYNREIEDLKNTYSNFIISDEDISLFEEKLKKYDNIEKTVSNFDEITSTYKDIKDYSENIKEKNKSDMEYMLEELKNQEVIYATNSEKEDIKVKQDEMKAEIDNINFREAKKIGDTLQELVNSYNEKKTGLSVRVAQTDYSAYPNIKLYLDIIDSNGNVVSGINNEALFISEKKTGENNLRKSIVTNVSQLNEKEALNMNLVLDTSGSMQGTPLTEAKNIMEKFINNIQFQVGDSVKFTSFNSFIDKETEFMSDISGLKNILYSLNASGGTKLYDTLIYAVQDTSIRDGAKCVIAFTDGMDEHSLKTADDVVQAAKKYGVPIYIVRIGSGFGYGEIENLSKITEQSGGKLYTNISFNDNIEDIYYQIYRDLKQYYVVEYTAQDDYDVSDNVEYDVYVRSGEQGGSCTGGYIADQDIFENLYLRFLDAYIEDMNNHEYNKMDEYIESNVDRNDKNAYYLYNQMNTQVTGGFADVESESLISAQIDNIEKKDDNTYLLYTTEEYDALYVQTLEELKGDTQAGSWKMDRVSAEKALEILNEKYNLEFYDDDTEFAVWKAIYEKVVYQIKKSDDGTWKFYKYDKAIDFYKEPEVYSADFYYDYN